jgi:hypothetical protein
VGYREREAARNHRLKAGRNAQREEGANLTCECSDLRCNATIRLTSAERSNERSNGRDRPNRFWVKPGHVMITVERIVEENDRYAIVEGDPHAALYDAPSA